VLLSELNRTFIHTPKTGVPIEVRLTSRGNFIDDPDFPNAGILIRSNHKSNKAGLTPISFFG
jgi:hypothetical protein